MSRVYSSVDLFPVSRAGFLMRQTLIRCDHLAVSTSAFRCEIGRSSVHVGLIRNSFGSRVGRGRSFSFSRHVQRSRAPSKFIHAEFALFSFYSVYSLLFGSLFLPFFALPLPSSRVWNSVYLIA